MPCYWWAGVAAHITQDWLLMFHFKANQCHIIFTLDECTLLSSSLFLLVLPWAVDWQNPRSLPESKLWRLWVNSFTWRRQDFNGQKFPYMWGCVQVMQPQHMADIHYTISSDKSGSQAWAREYIIPSQSLVWFHLVLHLKSSSGVKN